MARSFEGLEPAQAGTIYEFIRRADIPVGLIGVDELCRPVLHIDDAKRTFMMAVRHDGSGCSPTGSVRWFTDDEIVNMQEKDSLVLFRLPVKQPTPEVRK